MIRTVQKLSLVAAAIALSIGAVGCSAPGGSAESGGEGTDKSSTSTETGNKDRAFDATNDTVVTALKTALDADDVTFDGKSVKVHFNTGSVKDPVATIGCLAIQTIIADDEIGFKVYSDGEIDCSELY